MKPMILMIILLTLAGCCGGNIENCSGSYGPRCPAGTVEMLNSAGTAFVCVRKK